MKKYFINALLLVFVLSANAQSKQELQTTINNLNQQIGQLKAMLDAKSAQLDQANQTITELRAQLANQKPAARKSVTYRDSIADVMEKYTNCETWEQAAEYVMEPERVKPIMRKYYQINQFGGNVWTAEEVLKENLVRKTGKKYPVYMCRRYYIVKTSEGYKIDWEASERYNQVSAPELIAKPGQVAVVRQDFINLDKSYDNDWFYKVGYVGDSYILVRKDSAVGKKLFALTKDDKAYDMTLKMQSKLDGDYVYLEVLDIVSTTFSNY